MSEQHRAQSPAFERLQTFHNRSYGCMGVYKKNAFEFIGISQRNGSIHKYSSTSNQWLKLDGMGPIRSSLGIASVYDASRDRIFVVQRDRRLEELNLATSNLRTQCLRFSFDFGSMLLIGDRIHIFGQQKNPKAVLKHGVFDIKSGSFDIDLLSTPLQQLDIDERNERLSIVQALFLKSRNSIMMLCRFTNDPFQSRVYDLECQSGLIDYCLNTQQSRRLKWSVTDCKGVATNTMVSTLDGRYIVIFEEETCEGIRGHVTVCDLKESTVTRSNIQCPLGAQYRYYRAILLGSNERDELITFGFVRQTFKASEFGDVQEIPIHLTQLMSKWYCNEKVHLMALQDDGHWVIDMDKIILSIQKHRMQN